MVTFFSHLYNENMTFRKGAIVIRYDIYCTTLFYHTYDIVAIVV